MITVFVWFLEGLQKLMERLDVTFFASLQGFLDLVVAGDDGWVDGAHEGEGRVQVLFFLPETRLPTGMPGLEVFVTVKLFSRKFFLAQVTEGIGVVGRVLMHPVEQVGYQAFILLLCLGKPDLGSHHGEPLGFVNLFEGVQGILGHADRVFPFGMHQGQEALGQTGEVSLGDERLIGIGIASLVIDRTEDRIGGEDVHEGTGSVIDGFSGKGHVVGVHDSVDKAHSHPMGDQVGLLLDDRFQEGEGFVFLHLDRWEVPIDQVVEECLGDCLVLMEGCEFEGSHPQMRAGDAGQDCTGQFVFPVHRFPGRDDRQAARGGDFEGMHGFADDVFPEHRSEGGPPVSTPRVWGSSRALELQIKALAGWGNVFAQHNGPSVPQHREVSELMTGIGLGQGFGSVGNEVSGKEFGPFFPAHAREVQANFLN